jgi:hypothetical protein
MKKISCFLHSVSNIITLLLLSVSINAVFAQSNDAGLQQSINGKIVSTLNVINKGGQADIYDLFSQASQDRGQTIRGLLKILNDPASKANVKLYAVYYLGAMHATEAVNNLAAQITLAPNGITGGSLYVTESPWNGASAVNSLVSIGIKSIPALIRNLATSDGSKIRGFTLRALSRIDGDKDISQLRLQKALNDETDSTKKANLSAALKELQK